jgi:hypothetical protein
MAPLKLYFEYVVSNSQSRMPLPVAARMNVVNVAASQTCKLPTMTDNLINKNTPTIMEI